MLRRPTPEWYVMVDFWLNIPYPEWYVRYVKVHFQAAQFPDAFMGAFSQEARGPGDVELAQVCAHPLQLYDLLVHLHVLCMLVPVCMGREGGRAFAVAQRLSAPKAQDCLSHLPFWVAQLALACC